MGYDLESYNGYFYCNIWNWGPLLQLARDFGWEAEGTLAPPNWYNDENYSEDDWKGSYIANEGACFKITDAVSLANALELALKFIPDEDRTSLSAVHNKIEKCISDEIPGTEGKTHGEEGTPHTAIQFTSNGTVIAKEISDEICGNIFIAALNHHQHLSQKDLLVWFSGNRRGLVVGFVVFLREAVREAQSRGTLGAFSIY